MLVTRTPLRLSLGGGGTDLPSYYERFGGFVISAAINRHVYIAISRSFHPGYHLKYSRVEAAQSLDEIQHPLFREALRLHQIEPRIDISSIAEVPAGTGLGSSGAFLVGLVHALRAYKRQTVNAELLAREAISIDMGILGEPVGKQDQYVAAYGGITCQEYHADGTATITPLKMPETAVRELKEGMMLFFTGQSRKASNLLSDQKKRSTSGDAAMLENLHFIKDLGLRIKSALEEGDMDAFAGMMHEHWLRKRARSQGMSNDRINAAYDRGMANGALGGKLVGAGGGGFLLFFTRQRAQLRRAMADIGFEELDFSFDHDGSIVMVRD
ncbi:MAG TPA: galactokinase [Terriglobia bacterium]|nr:galactokinase [Terriglobia bacterium]